MEQLRTTHFADRQTSSSRFYLTERNDTRLHTSYIQSAFPQPWTERLCWYLQLSYPARGREHSSTDGISRACSLCRRWLQDDDGYGTGPSRGYRDKSLKRERLRCG